MIIDSHTHLMPPDVRDNRSKYLDIDAAFASIYKEAKAAIASAEDLLESMEKHQVSHSIAVNYSWSTMDFCRITNDYILECAARFPDRITALCAVPDVTSDESLREIERCAGNGARGIGEIRPDFCPEAFLQPESLSGFADLLKQHNLVLLLHASEPVGHMYSGKGTATPGLIFSFLSAYPDIPTICAHWGGGLPFYFLMPEIKKLLKNVYFDTAASPFLYDARVYDIVRNLAGADRILFGSDYPLMPPSRLLPDMESSTLSSLEKELILAGNAQRLFEF